MERKFKAIAEADFRKREAGSGGSWYYIPFPVKSIKVQKIDGETIQIPMIKGVEYTQAIDGVEELLKQLREGEDSAFFRLIKLSPDAYHDPRVKKAVSERAMRENLWNPPCVRRKKRGRPIDAALKQRIVFVVNALVKIKKTSKLEAFGLLENVFFLSFDRIRNVYYEARKDRGFRPLFFRQKKDLKKTE